MFFENYESRFLEEIRKSHNDTKDFLPINIKLKNFEIFLPKSFGFCFGVRNAMKIVSDAIHDNKSKNIYLLSEVIHNQNINDALINEGVKFIFDKTNKQLIPYDKLASDDTCIIPAFGTTTQIYKILNDKIKKENIYDACCPFVKKVWEASKKIGLQNATIMIHGKFNHEETKATFSQAKEYGPVIVIKDKLEAEFLANSIKGNVSRVDFYNKFQKVITDNFDYDKHLKKIGIVNQTTMLAEDTQEISQIIKNALIETNNDFIDIGNTLCYATSKNQASVKRLMQEKLDIVLVVGGFNSSNTTNLYKIAKKVNENTFFIKDSDSLISKDEVLSFDTILKEEKIIKNYLNNVSKIGIIAGASCPDTLIEKVIKKLESF